MFLQKKVCCFVRNAKLLYDIRKMIDLAKENGDRIITASRRLPMGSFGNYPKIKYVLNRLFNLSARLLLGSRQTDLSFPYQCIPTRYIQQHDFIKSCDAVMLELCFLPVLDGYDFCEIPSRLYDRKSGRSSSGFRYYLRYLHTYLCIVLTYYKNKRMKLK